MKLRLQFGLTAIAVLATWPAQADPIDIEIYGTLVPYTEYVSTNGSTKPGHTGGADQVAPGAYTGYHDRPRFRMTPNTSNIGFRGNVDIVGSLKLIWQIENAVPIDGASLPNTFASRNSHIGLGSDYGSVIFGIWDTPYKWALATSVNVLKAGYVTDFTPIISTPGFAVGALNTASGYAQPAAGGPPNASNAAFHRREANSIQYWSPKVAGFSARLAYVINEGRNSGVPVGNVGTNPWVFSGSLGWEGAGLKVSYAYEQHHDYFGMASLGGSGNPSPNVNTSDDMGHDGIVAYKFAPSPDFTTRIAATGELLAYKSNDKSASPANPINQYSRLAFYGIVEQSIYKHHVWAAYGQALEGECERVHGGACSTAGLGAKYITVGYLFQLAEKSSIQLIGYGVLNDPSARYATFPALSPIAPGADQIGIGLGFFHAFNVGIIGDKPDAKPKEEKPTAAPPAHEPVPPTTPDSAAAPAPDAPPALESSPPVPEEKK